VRRLTRSAQDALGRDNPRAITRHFAKLDEAEQQLRSAAAAAPFVDSFSWSAVDQVMHAGSDARTDSRHSAERAVELEGRVAAAIETCTRELEQKLEQLIQDFGAVGAVT
jgi:hypothetical protein